MNAAEVNKMLDAQGLVYKLLYKPTSEVEQLLQETVYGTKGLLYSHLDAVERAHNLKNGHFHTLWRNENLVALAVYCGRQLLGSKLHSRYIRFFAVNKSEQAKGLGKLLTVCVEQHYLNNENIPTLFYAYIDNKNLKSMKVSGHFNGKVCGHFNTYLISRFSPKKSANVRRAHKEDKPEIIRLLNSTYKNHAELHFDYLFYQNNYFVLEKNGEILAGVQANPVKWEIVAIPGFQGFFMKYIIPAIPFVNRLFNPKTFRFTGFEGVYYKNSPKELEELFAHCLAEQGNYTAMFWADVKDDYLQEIAKSCHLGFISKVQHSPQINFIVIPHLLSENEEQEIADKPKYISAFDVT
ncbi:MAG: hypothetical protein ACK4K0_11625 [Flavobacteriales bacterium]